MCVYDNPRVNAECHDVIFFFAPLLALFAHTEVNDELFVLPTVFFIAYSALGEIIK